MPQRRSRRQPTLQVLHLAARRLALGLALWSPGAAQAAWPAAFVDLAQIAPDIAQEIRYAGPYNFTGAPLPGYRRPRCALLAPVARRLKSVDTQLAKFGLGLKVYDCYRPVRASQAMVRWGERTHPLGAAEQYFLGSLTRAAVMSGKFVAPRSRHNRGTTVDVTLIVRGDKAKDLGAPPAAGPHCGAVRESLPMGTAHDCFDPRSATRSPQVPAATRALRALLYTEMQRAGFDNFAKEWWHFTFAVPPVPSAAYDFDID